MVINVAVEGASDTIEEISGSRPRACPWMSFAREVVVFAINAHGDGARVGRAKIPHAGAQAIEEYERALNRVQGKLDRMEREKRERAAKKGGRRGR